MNNAMRRLEGLVGEWDVTMIHAWFLDSLDSLDAEIKGSATFEWLADAFIVMRSRWEDDSTQRSLSGGFRCPGRAVPERPDAARTVPGERLRW